MDFQDLLPEMLRSAKKPAPPPSPLPGDLATGGAALADPAYAAYEREAKAMGEPVMTRDQFHKR